MISIDSQLIVDGAVSIKLNDFIRKYTPCSVITYLGLFEANNEYIIFDYLWYNIHKVQYYISKNLISSYSELDCYIYNHSLEDTKNIHKNGLKYGLIPINIYDLNFLHNTINDSHIITISFKQTDSYMNGVKFTLLAKLNYKESQPLVDVHYLQHAIDKKLQLKRIAQNINETLTVSTDEQKYKIVYSPVKAPDTTIHEINFMFKGSNRILPILSKCLVSCNRHITSLPLLPLSLLLPPPELSKNKSYPESSKSRLLDIIPLQPASSLSVSLSNINTTEDQFYRIYDVDTKINQMHIYNKYVYTVRFNKKDNIRDCELHMYVNPHDEDISMHITTVVNNYIQYDGNYMYVK